MAKKNPLDRYVVVGMDFTRITRKRAESLVRDLVKEGAVGREHAGDYVEDLLARSRRRAERLSEVVSKEVRRQVEQLGLVNSDEVTKIVERLVTKARSTGEQTVRSVAEHAETARKASADELSRARSEGEAAVGSAVGRVKGVAAKAPLPARRATKKAPVGTGSEPASAPTSAHKSATPKRPARQPAAKKASTAHTGTAKKAAPERATKKAATEPAGKGANGVVAAHEETPGSRASTSGGTQQAKKTPPSS